MTDRRQRLQRMLEGSPYVAYLYSYPHKTAHRPLKPPVPLRELWRDERREALFLYIHVPFCTMGCGYCNLLSNKARLEPVQVDRFLAALERQASIVRSALGGSTAFARLAVGGGTPTALSEVQLARVLDVAEKVMGADLGAIPTCVEVSPATTAPEKMRLLRERGVDRISVGVQSFVEAEQRALRRRQSPGQVHAALELVRSLRFPTLNVDLIYGVEGQDEQGWSVSLDQALGYQPEEIYLYPLYVRPLTPLGDRGHGLGWDDQRLRLYRTGRDRLLGAGYHQVSMRMFRGPHAEAARGPLYRCQEDGMVGLACGARSYTRGLHYSTEFAVSPGAVRELIEAYIARTDESFGRADHGIAIDAEDQRRRYVILSLLLAEGLDLEAYRARFGTEVFVDLPELDALEPAGLARHLATDRRLVLTEAGLERSDLIGPWLHSDRVQGLMDGHRLR